MWTVFTAAFRFRLRRLLRLGLQSLWRHRLRSVLTVLGIVFGVCSVIAMLAIGEGASYEAQEQIKRLGSQNIILRSVKPPQDERASAETTRMIEYGLTYDDAERIATTVPAVEVVVPVRIIREDARHRTRRLDVRLKGTVPWYDEVAKLEIEPGGRFIRSTDMHNRLSVCVLGSAVARTLFPNHDPIGEYVTVGAEYYRVVGVVAERGRGSRDDPASDTSRDIYVPLTTMQERYGEIVQRQISGSMEMERVELHQVSVRVKDTAYVEKTAAIIRQLLERYHRKQDFEVVVPLELLRQAERTKRIFNIVLGSIAAISLVVGGIGIMNIMLASVTERTREIGIRRALGAKRRDIVSQFLTETILLSGSGGILGLILGVVIPVLVRVFSGMPTIITAWSLVLAFAISVAVGIVFGIYPAYRAAHMDPIEALRHE